MTLLDNLTKYRKVYPHGQPFTMIHNLTKYLLTNMSKINSIYEFHFGTTVSFLRPVGNAFEIRLDWGRVQSPFLQRVD